MSETPAKFPVDREAFMERREKERKAQAIRVQSAISHGGEGICQAEHALMALRTRNADGVQEGSGASYLRKAIVELQTALKSLEGVK